MRPVLLSCLLVFASARRQGRVPVAPDDDAVTRFFLDRLGRSPDVTTTAEPGGDLFSSAYGDRESLTSTTTAGPTLRGLQEFGNETNGTNVTGEEPEEEATEAPEETSAPDTAAPTSAVDAVTTTPPPTPAGSTQRIVASLAIEVSAEELQSMLDNPEVAVAGLEDGFATYIGVDPDYVTILCTDPDFGKGACTTRARRLAQGSVGRSLQSSLTAEYAVDLPPELLADSPDLLANVENKLDAANDDDAALGELGAALSSSLSDAGIPVTVEVTGVVAEVVIVTAAPTPAPTPKPTTATTKDTAADDDDDEDDDDDSASGGGVGGNMTMIVGAVVVIGIVVAIGGFVMMQQQPAAPATEASGAAATPEAASSPAKSTPKAQVETPATAAELEQVDVEVAEPEPGEESAPSPATVALGATGLEEVTTEGLLVTPAGPTVDTEPDVRPWWWFGCAPACVK